MARNTRVPNSHTYWLGQIVIIFIYIYLWICRGSFELCRVLRNDMFCYCLKLVLQTKSETNTQILNTTCIFSNHIFVGICNAQCIVFSVNSVVWAVYTVSVCSIHSFSGQYTQFQLEVNTVSVRSIHSSSVHYIWFSV